MLLLYKVDVAKSRQECAAFIGAEAGRDVFSGSHFDGKLAEHPAGAEKVSV